METRASESACSGRHMQPPEQSAGLPYMGEERVEMGQWQDRRRPRGTGYLVWKRAAVLTAVISSVMAVVAKATGV